MKKSILTFAILSPITASAQASRGLHMGDFIGLLIGLAIGILLFLALRQVMLWYWKVDKIVKNQEEQTRLLRGIYHILDERKGKNSPAENELPNAQS